MNTIDLVVYLVLALALFEGWRRGAILQICSLAGLVAGIWLAARYGAAVGTWLGIDPAASAAGGFAAVLVATVIVFCAGCSVSPASAFRIFCSASPSRC